MKRHKKNPVNTSSDGDAQVFVLSPNLLEKLGIQLPNFASSNPNIEDNPAAEKSDHTELKDDVGNSSILETANLMKQSVFMSPTFLTPTETETSSELIAFSATNKTLESNHTNKTDNQLQMIVDCIVTGVDNADNLEQNTIIDSTCDVVSENIMKYQPIDEYEVDNTSGELVLTSNSYESQNIANTDISGLNKIEEDEHADEAYSSDGSNSNSGHGSDTLQLATEHHNPKTKIKILSEQIIPSYDLNNIKNPEINKKNSCFHIPVNTILTGKAIKDCSDNISTQFQILEEELYNNQSLNTEVGDYIENSSIVDSGIVLPSKDPKSLTLHNIKNNISHKLDTNEKILDNDVRQVIIFKEVGAGIDLNVKTLCDNTKGGLASNTENSLIKSKLLIQGVEKPGGTRECQGDKVLKTYPGTKAPKDIPEVLYIDYAKIEDSSILPEDVETHLDNINISGYRSANKFCICNDYGQLAFPDSDDDVYEHLHFHNHRNVCKLETFLSMYDNEPVLHDRTKMEHCDMLDDATETASYNICWLSLMSEDKDDDKHIIVMENNLTSGQPRRSPRKRKSTTEHVAEKAALNSKMTITCGACGLSVPKVEWNKHKDKEHNLIAWKDNEPINLKNKALVKSLGNKLKKLGYLKCTFCKTDIKYLTRFIQHVRKCIKRKVACTNSKSNSTTAKKTQTLKLPQTRQSLRNSNVKIDSHETENAINKSKISSDKKITPIAPKAETKVYQKFTQKVEVKDNLKSKVTSKVEEIKAVKPIKDAALINKNISTAKVSKNIINPEGSPPINKTIIAKSKRGSTIENNNDSIVKSEDTPKVGEKHNAPSRKKSLRENKDNSEEMRDILKSKNIRKIIERDIPKSHIKTGTEIMVTPKAEVNDIRKSKVSPKSEIKATSNKAKQSRTELKDTLKSDFNDMQPKDTPKLEVKGTGKLTKTTIADSKVPKIEVKVVSKRNNTKLDVKSSPKLTRLSIYENKDAIVEEVKEITQLATSDSLKSPVTEYAEPQEASKVINEVIPRSTRRSSKVEVITKPASCTERKTCLKSPNMLVGMVVDNSKPTLTKDVNTASKSKSPYKGTLDDKHTKDVSTLDDFPLKSNMKSKTNSKSIISSSPNETAVGKLKEIDLFSSTSSFKNAMHIGSTPKSINMSKNIRDNLQSPIYSVSETSKSKSGLNEAKNTKSLKRKSIDFGASIRTPKKCKDENKGKETASKTVIETHANIGTNVADTSVNKIHKDFKESIESTSTEHSENAGKVKPEMTPQNTFPPKSPRSTASKAKPLEDCTLPEKEDISLGNTEAVKAKTTTAGNSNSAKSNSQSAPADASSSENSEHNVHSSSNVNSNQTSDGSDNSPPNDKIYVIEIKSEILPKCGVCKQPVDELKWLEHIATEHGYLAWRENEIPLDLDNDEDIRAHLGAIAKRHGGLKCFKCNAVRKYPKAYRSHVLKCNGANESLLDASTTSVDMDTTRDPDDAPLSTSAVRDTPGRPKRSSLRKSRMDFSSASVDEDVSTMEDEDNTPLKSLSQKARKNSLLAAPRDVVCAVCNATVSENNWIDHIRLEHKYLAWQIGQPPVNVDDEIEVKIFLQNISKHNRGLICNKCGAVRHYVKKWFEHVAVCNGEVDNDSSSSEDYIPGKNQSNKSRTLNHELEILPDTLKCGKCGKEMAGKAWLEHNETDHSYLGWIEGQTPLDENDSEALIAHLYALSKKLGTLYCARCGTSRKYPKTFLTHVSACQASGFKREDYYVEVSAEVRPDQYECAVCLEKGPLKEWKKHAMSKHYNIAWITGQIPLNLKNPYAVEKNLKEYRNKHSLVCKVCGATRASCYGFYAHILACGKTEKEMEHLMNMCDICNNKYLCIYKNQHMTMHREQQKNKEQKEINAIKSAEEKLRKKAELAAPVGKRRAAEKAKKVMEKYTSTNQDGTPVCMSCHSSFETKELLESHVCQEKQDGAASDSDVSVKIEEQDSSEDDMEVDSNASDEEVESPIRRTRHAETQPKIVLPFKVKDNGLYLAKSFKHFCEIHYTSKSLFDTWRCNDYKMLSEEEASTYMPSLTDSCKIKLGDDGWNIFSRFEAKKKRDNMAIFTGATVRSVSWVPNNIDNEDQDHYLSLSCFQHSDCPRYGRDELHQHPGLLQIWNFSRFTCTPKFDVGIAHDYGTVWAMDWCPSGARDIVSAGKEGAHRLGLLAIACSNGSAYVLAVPVIRAKGGPTICKLKPVAELRISMKPKHQQHKTTRPRYQATSISWSPQNKHALIMVGYSDGTTAFYNLNAKSPFLQSVEDGVQIFYPFHDALTENSSVTAVALSACQDMSRMVGGVASSSVTGATMLPWPAAGAVVRSHLAASSITYTPNWPAALLCSDDVLTAKATNEMEWWGGGRRFGGGCAAGACARCGRMCLAAPPFVRVLRAHPCYPELKKQIVATLKMLPIAQKRKLKTDDLGMVVEPLAYDETVQKYGLEFKTLPKKNQKVASKLRDSTEQCPERFPLSEMPAVAFCPSASHHSRLAIASHAGFVFIIVS